MKRLGAWKGLVGLGLVYVALGVFFRASLLPVLRVSGTYLAEMALIVPAVVLLMGLFEVWVPKDMIQRFLGRRAGLKGMLLAFVMGTAPTGPLYLAFPIAASLTRKGASLSSVVVFLGAWAAAKIPQIAMEAKFLGLKFAVVRLVLTAASLLVMGLIGEVVIGKPDKETAGGDPSEVAGSEHPGAI